MMELRAFDKTNDIMIPFALVLNETGTHIAVNDYISRGEAADLELIWMPFTGRRDKYQTKIFLNDNLMYLFENGTVIFEEAAYKIVLDDGMKIPLMDIRESELQVIGNTYETK